MGTTILYTSIIIVAGLLIDRRNYVARNRYIFIVCLILTVISGFRSIWVGTDDTYIYSQSFEDCAGMSYQQIADIFKKDTFYYILNHFFASALGLDFRLMLIAFAVFYMYSLGYLLRKESTNPMVSFIVLLTMGYFFFQMNGVRQGLAIAFVLLSYIPLKNRKFKPFLLLVLSGALFHLTCLVFLIAYPLANLELKKSVLFLYVIIVVVCLVFGQSILNALLVEAASVDPRFAGYQTYQAKLTYSGLIQLLMFAVFSFTYYKRVVANDKRDVALYTMLILGIIFQSMAIFIAEMFRISMYFSIFLILLLPKVFDAIPSANRKLFSFVLCALLCVYYFGFGFGIIPYRFYWNDVVF